MFWNENLGLVTHHGARAGTLDDLVPGEADWARHGERGRRVARERLEAVRLEACRVDVLIKRRGSDSDVFM